MRAPREERPLPIIALGEEPLEVRVGVGDGALAELRLARHVLDGVVDAEPPEEVVLYHPVRIERGAGVEALRLPPGEVAGPVSRILSSWI